ncbi:MAG: insulinase family protein [Clostridia bacterium]|nr:insulinase family protein [Clostridia bacterium]
MTLQKVHVTEHIHLSCIQTDKFKTGVLTLTLPIPIDRKSVIFSAILPEVLRRGTERYPDMAALNRRLDELYAACVEIRNTQVGKNLALVLTAEVLDDAYAADEDSILDGVMEVLAQMLLHPRMTDGSFDRAIVEQEKRFKRDTFRSAINHTRILANIRLAELMSREDDSQPTLKEREDGLEEINETNLAEFYRRLLSRAPLEAFYVGTLPPQAVADKLLRFFGEWNAPLKQSLLLPLAEKSAGYCSKVETMPVSQGKLAMGFRTGVTASQNSSDYYTALVINEIFGGSPASKLFMNVREKMSLCYYCSSSYNQYNGILSVSAGIESANRERTEKAILEQLEQIRLGNVSETEFRAAKVSLENAYRQIYDNPFELQAFFGNRSLFGLSESIEDCRRGVATVTPEDVIALAGRVIHDTVFFIEGTLSGEGKEEQDD